MRELRKHNAAARPREQFERWFADSQDAGSPLAEGMTLATVGLDGVPRARTVLLKETDERGLVFFTNYRSQKAKELAQNPNATLLFWWPLSERQVRITGRVERITAAQSDAYHVTRPRGSQLGGWSSPQSEVVADRGALERAFEEVSARFAGGEIPRPQHWGGYRLVPVAAEFWQGRANRLHDRLLYRLTDPATDTWSIVRLAP